MSSGGVNELTTDNLLELVDRAARSAQMAAVERARQEEREQCCRDICHDCAAGVPVVRNGGEWPFWRHQSGHKRPACFASAIRERTRKEAK
jgi:hypothetical protein